VLIQQLSKNYSRVVPLYIESGHVWERAERYWLTRFLKAIHKRQIQAAVRLACPSNDVTRDHWGVTGERIPSARSRDKAVYIPGKNILLIAKASIFCAVRKIPNLALGPLKSNPFPDANARFFRDMEQTVSEGLNFKIKIHAPFLKSSKEQVMALGDELPLHLTFSCLSPKRFRHCGKCNKCAERKKAFRHSGLLDKTVYAK